MMFGEDFHSESFQLDYHGELSVQGCGGARLNLGSVQTVREPRPNVCEKRLIQNNLHYTITLLCIDELCNIKFELQSIQYDILLMM